jgi:hypothetical protein
MRPEDLGMFGGPSAGARTTGGAGSGGGGGGLTLSATVVEGDSGAVAGAGTGEGVATAGGSGRATGAERGHQMTAATSTTPAAVTGQTHPGSCEAAPAEAGDRGCAWMPRAGSRSRSESALRNASRM